MNDMRSCCACGVEIDEYVILSDRVHHISPFICMANNARREIVEIAQQMIS